MKQHRKQIRLHAQSEAGKENEKRQKIPQDRYRKLELNGVGTMQWGEIVTKEEAKTHRIVPCLAVH